MTKGTNAIGKFELLLGELTDLTTRLNIHRSNLEDHHAYLYGNFGPIEVAEPEKPVEHIGGFFNDCSNQVQAMQAIVHDIEIYIAVIAEATHKA